MRELSYTQLVENLTTVNESETLLVGTKMIKEAPISFSQEVEEAIKNNSPIVALESAMLFKGFPYPRNIHIIELIQEQIRRDGATPAIIAIFDGKIHIGLNDQEITRLAKENPLVKVSTSDIPKALTSKQNGITTAAATMHCANLCGIDVFAAGGVGGVHRGAETTFDISPDLEQLGKSPVLVISGGMKAVLDIPKTLEVLETIGIPVFSYQSDYFPAHWVRSSGLPTPSRVETPEQIAHIWKASRQINLKSGLLIANPIDEKESIPASELEECINNAVMKETELGIKGKAVTPYIIEQLTLKYKDRITAANFAVLRNNTSLATKVAKVLK